MVEKTRVAQKVSMPSKNESEAWRWIQTLLVVWTVALLGGVIVCMFRGLGLIDVKGFTMSKFKPSQMKGVILYHRHPSMIETMIIPVLFFPRFLWDPYAIPLSVPDTHNYYNKWWWRPLRVVSIPMPRGNPQGEGRAVLQMLEELRKRRTITIAFEGGRTWKGTLFKQLMADGTIVAFKRAELADLDGKLDLSKPVIRRFRKGAKHLASAASFVPAWVAINKWKIRIVVGDRFIFDTSFPEEDIVGCLENLLLQSAEE